MTPPPEPDLTERDLSQRGLSGAQEHLRRLIGCWSLLADLSFSDLLLFVRGRVNPLSARMPVPPLDDPPPDDSVEELTVVAQIRPTTSRTLYMDDYVGNCYSARGAPIVTQVIQTGEVATGEGQRVPVAERARITAYPVNYEGRMIAVLSSEVLPRYVSIREFGELEAAYHRVSQRLMSMVVAGTFPYREDDFETGDVFHVGDGLMIVDASTAIEFASPNAVSSLRRLGFKGDVLGKYLRDLDLGIDLAGRAISGAMPMMDEVERNSATVQVQVLPLTDSPQRGALVMLRDVSELRSRDRLLISKDATIREIHHRVTNNLQTVSSLLRIQARRLESDEANKALDEAVRRIGAIALVHQTLAGAATEDVEFCEVAHSLTETLADSIATPQRRIDFSVSCEPCQVPSQTATTLAVVLNELLQNTVDHAFPQFWLSPGAASETDEVVGNVEVVITRPSADELELIVRDNGIGIPPHYDPQRSSGLGTSIVRALCVFDLGGVFDVHRRTDTTGSQAIVRLNLLPDSER